MADDDIDMPFPEEPPAPKRKGRPKGVKLVVDPPAQKVPAPIIATGPVPVMPVSEQAIPAAAPESQPETEDDGDLTMVLGQPTSEWSPDELTYISEREADILNQLGAANKGSARPLVDEVILCDLQMKRLDREMARCRKTNKRDIAKMSTELKPLDAMRAQYMNRMTEAMTNLGIMPKNYVQTDAAAASLTELHSRYRAELDRRRKLNWPVGSLTKE